MRKIPIPIPPLAEQKRIVLKVDALMALLDELEQQEQRARELATELLEAVVYELTSQSR